MIYAMEVFNFRFVKIGYTSSNSVDQRIKSMQTGSPFKISPVICARGSLAQEKELHKALDSAFGRIGIPIPPNEWYPGRHQLMKWFLHELKSNGVNSAIAYLDSFNPAVNSMIKKGELANHDVKKEWPLLSKSMDGEIFGYDGGGKKYKSKRFDKISGNGIDRLNVRKMTKG